MYVNKPTGLELENMWCETTLEAENWQCMVIPQGNYQTYTKFPNVVHLKTGPVW